MKKHDPMHQVQSNSTNGRALLVYAVAAILIFSAGSAFASDMDSDLENAVLESKVWLALLTELGLDSLQVEIAVDDADVSLTGTVDKRQTRELAKTVVATVEGVESVNNDIELEAKDGDDPAKTGAVEELERETKDSILATNVKLKLMSEFGSDALSIHVEAGDGKVVLSGNVDAETDVGAAKKAAASVEGVTDVVNRISMKG